MILGVGAIQSGLLRVITFKTLAITHRCLELVLFFLPMLKNFFNDKLPEKQANLNKQFTSLDKVKHSNLKIKIKKNCKHF